jgi:hypothetical protein
MNVASIGPAGSSTGKQSSVGTPCMVSETGATTSGVQNGWHRRPVSETGGIDVRCPRRVAIHVRRSKRMAAIIPDHQRPKHPHAPIDGTRPTDTMQGVPTTAGARSGDAIHRVSTRGLAPEAREMNVANIGPAGSPTGKQSSVGTPCMVSETGATTSGVRNGWHRRPVSKTGGIDVRRPKRVAPTSGVRNEWPRSSRTINDRNAPTPRSTEPDRRTPCMVSLRQRYHRAEVGTTGGARCQSDPVGATSALP